MKKSGIYGLASLILSVFSAALALKSQTHDIEETVEAKLLEMKEDKEEDEESEDEDDE